MKKVTFLALAIFLLASPALPVFGQVSPYAYAGPDITLNAGQSAVLQGLGYDPNGYALDYFWQCDSGTLSDDSVAKPTYTAPDVVAQYVGAPTSYVCALTVSNSYGDSYSDSSIIYVNYSAAAGPAYTTGPTYVPTGVANNSFADSFLLPMLMIVLMSWLYFTGRIHRFSDWLKARI